MKKQKLAFCLVLCLIVFVVVGSGYLYRRATLYPSAKKVEPTVHSFLTSNGFQISVEHRGGLPRQGAPLSLNPIQLLKEGRLKHRLGGVSTPYEHCDIYKYVSTDHGELTVEIDIAGEKVYQVIWVGDSKSTNLYSEFLNSMNDVGVPIRFEQKKDGDKIIKGHPIEPYTPTNAPSVPRK